MNKLSSRMCSLISMLLTAILVFSCCPPISHVKADEQAQCPEFNNVNAHDYPYYWQIPGGSFMTVTDNGYMLVMGYKSGVCTELEGEIYVEYMDSSFRHISGKYITLDLPLFGTFIEDGNYYYIISGQTNMSESPDVDCYGITKYDKNWNRISYTGVRDCNTSSPFGCGINAVFHNGLMYIRAGHTKYASTDGLRHESNIQLVYDPVSEQIVNPRYNLSFHPYGYVSHSFWQYMVFDGDMCYFIDQGDAYPRSLVVTPLNFADNNFGINRDMIIFPGEEGDNNTGTNVGGAVLTSNRILVAGRTVLSTNTGSDSTSVYQNEYAPHNIFISSLDPDTGEVTFRKMTSYSISYDYYYNCKVGCEASNPFIIDIGNDLYLVMWSVYYYPGTDYEPRDNGDEIYCQIVDSYGNNVGDTMEFNAHLSDCTPVRSGNSLVWFTVEGIERHLYTLSLSDFTLSSASYPHNIENAVFSDIPDQIYNGDYIYPEFTVTCNGTQLTENVDYTVEFNGNIGANEAAIYIHGIGDYYGTAESSFLILPRDINDATVSYIPPQVYSGTTPTPEFTITINGEPLLEMDYFYRYYTNLATNTGRVEIYGQGYYTGTKIVEYELLPDPNATPTPSAGSGSGGSSSSGSSSSGSSSGSSSSGSSSSGGYYSGSSSGSLSSGSSSSGYSGGSSTPASSGTGVEGFVERLYTIALGRASDPVGKADWVAAIVERGNTGADAARGFLYSSEFLNKNVSNEEFVTILYRVFFDRNPDIFGLISWIDALERGASKQDVIEGFINSIEWANVCLQFGINSGGTAAPSISVEPSAGTIDFCTRLYTTCLNRAADDNGLMAWARQLANRRDTGTGAAHGFFFSSEFLGQNVSNGEYVTRLYRTFMGREPDSAGYNAWVSQLDSGISREEVFNGFAASQEFGVICSQYGILR